MNAEQDRLETLLTRYKSQLESKRSELRVLEQNVALLIELKEEADNPSLFEASAIPLKATSANGIESASANALNAVLLTQAVLDAVQNFGQKPVSPPDIRKFLLSRGFRPQGKNFGVSVGTALRRLATQEKIKAIKAGPNAWTAYTAV